MKNEELVIHLIHEELRNLRFMMSFEDIGFDCSFFTINIGHVILELVGFEEINDELFDWYYGLIKKALEEITFGNLNEMLKKWSKKLHKELLDKKLKKNTVLHNESTIEQGRQTKKVSGWQ